MFHERMLKCGGFAAANVLQYVTGCFYGVTARYSTLLGVTLNVFIITQSRRPYHFATPLIYYAPSDKRGPSADRGVRLR